MRNIVYRFDDLYGFAQALRGADQELVLPAGEKVGDGEWVLAIFELGARGRATAAAARGLERGTGNFILSFERRDWERLIEFSEAKSEHLRVASIAPPSESEAIPIDVEDELATISRAPSIPAPPPPQPSSRPASSGKSSAAFGAGANSRVLLVDDDRDIREVVGAMLDAVGLKVETAVSAEEALERVRSIPPDLVILDWNLPGMTGIELCRVIRREVRLSGLPILFLTAHASSRDIVEAFASGADDYVVKPFRAPELGARIFGLLRRIRQTQLST